MQTPLYPARASKEIRERERERQIKREREREQENNGEGGSGKEESDTKVSANTDLNRSTMSSIRGDYLTQVCHDGIENFTSGKTQKK